MKNLKQLLTEKKYLEAKTLVLEDRGNLEESVDVLIEAVEDARTYILHVPEISDDGKDLWQKLKDNGCTLGGAQIPSDPNIPKGELHSVEFYTAESSPDFKISVEGHEPPNIGQALYWNDEKKELECSEENLSKWFVTTTLRLQTLPNVCGASYSVGEMDEIKFKIIGGDKQEIAKTILKNLPVGLMTFGNWTEFAQVDSSASPISFDYIEPPPITDIKVTCSFDIEEPEDLNKPSELEEA